MFFLENHEVFINQLSAGYITRDMQPLNLRKAVRGQAGYLHSKQEYNQEDAQGVGEMLIWVQTLALQA